MTEISKEKEFFPIKAVHRSDLDEVGFDGAAVDNSTMQTLVDILEEMYLEVHFWGDLEDIAEDMGIPKKGVPGSTKF